MATFDTMINRSPSYKVMVFNNKYSWNEAYANISVTANPYKSGWYEVPQDESNGQKVVGIERLKVKDIISEKSTAEFDILDSEFWMYVCDMIVKRDSSTSSPFIGGEITGQPDDSKLILYIDTDGIASPDTIGTIDIVGELDSSPVTETVTINGQGSYITTEVYDTVTSITLNDLTCHFSAFTRVNDTNARHEVQIWCDTNNDGVYGLMFGGYMLPVTKKVENQYNIITMKCVDYTDFLMRNEHIVGYRSNYRCSRYSNTGDYGDCSLKTTGTFAPFRWFTTATSNNKCYVGDMDTRHPDGTSTDLSYRCGDYVASTEVLPYDGYTYDENYVPNTDPKYSYYPQNYTRALHALKLITNAMDNRARSRDFDLHMKCSALAAEAIDISETGIDFDTKFPSASGSATFEANDFILIDDEWMLVQSNIGGTLTVTRGSLGSIAATHDDNSVIKCYSIANTTYASNAHDFLIEADIGGTLYDTGESISDILTSRVTNSYYQFWVDAYKQIHLTEMYRTDTSHSGSLTFTTDDILKVDKVEIGDVVNKISAWVETESYGKFYCELTSDDVTGITTSIPEFDLHSKEVKNDQLNVIGYDDVNNNKFGFLTFAEAYLKTHAYPKITQVITIDSFVPDEHYWTHGYNPLLDYNDGFNEYICLLGTRCVAPDFSLDEHLDRTFIIEAIEYDIKEFGNFETTITMSRISTAADW